MASYGAFPPTKIYLTDKVQKCELVPNVVSKLTPPLVCKSFPYNETKSFE